MRNKATTFLFAISLTTFFGCGGNISGSSTSGDPTQTTTEDMLPEHWEGAPRLTIPHTVSSETSVVVPITVEQFDEIGAYDLKLLYDPAIMRATAVHLGPSVGAYFFIGNHLTPGEISISYVYFQPGYQGISLTDGSTFLNITFEKVTPGVSDIAFDHKHPLYNSAGDFAGDELKDEPPEHFYIDGSLEFE